MEQQSLLRNVLEGIKQGTISVEEGILRLSSPNYLDIGYARLDHNRDIRTGAPEAVFCLGKTPQQVINIMKKLVDLHGRAIATRADKELYEAIKDWRPDLAYHPLARTIVISNSANEVERCSEGSSDDPDYKVMVVSAGTADLPVAEEAFITLRFLGIESARLYDVGVAGIHRLLDKADLLVKATAVIVVAGMDGALPGVVAGLVRAPVIAVPTSVGYGASFGGLAALLTMLNACAPGVAVVNIDNGFGAAHVAQRILLAK